MKKQRGLKRYYKKLEHKNEFDKTLELNLDDPQTWPKYWHLHFDLYGQGDHSFKKRKPHLDKVFRHFDFLVARTRKLDCDFQLYAVILDFHSSSDALFLHIHDSNNGQFPFKIEELSAETTLKNKLLIEYLESLDGYEKLYGNARQAFCLIYSKGAGRMFVKRKIDC